MSKGSLSEANDIDVEVAFFGAVSISTWLYGLLRVGGDHEGWDRIGFLIDLDFGNISVSSHPVGLFSDIVSLGPLVVAHFSSGAQVSLLIVLEVHAVTDKEVVREASLVEFHVLLVVGILLLVEQILLGSLRNVVTQKRVTLMELGLVLRNTSSSWPLHKLQNYENQAYIELFQHNNQGKGPSISNLKKMIVITSLKAIS